MGKVLLLFVPIMIQNVHTLYVTFNKRLTFIIL
jgi:hypothetical protein